MNKKKLPTILLGIVLLILSVIGAWRTVYFSADIDESYALTMAVRIVRGDRMFVDLWEPHQMSALLYAPVVFFYRCVTGGLTGILVFMRQAGILVQLLMSIWLYRFLKKECSSPLAMVLAFAYFNFTPKHIQSPEFTSLCYWLLMVLLLCLWAYQRNRGKQYPVLAGLAMSALVLCYPTMLVLFAVCLIWFLTLRRETGEQETYPEQITLQKEKRKAAGLFAGTCVLAGMLFLAFLFIRGGAGEVLCNIPNILSDASHTQNFLQLWKHHIVQLWDMLKLTLPLIIILQVGRPVLDKKNRYGFAILSILLAVQMVWGIYQFHTIVKVNFMVFFPILLQLFVIGWYAAVCFPQEREKKAAYRTCLLINLTAVFCIMSASNLDAVYSVSFLMPSVLFGFLMLKEAMLPDVGTEGAKADHTVTECAGAEKRELACRRMGKVVFALVLALFLIQLVTTRIFLVRFTSTQRKNLFEGYYQTQTGPLAGIRLGEFDYRQYEAKSAALTKYVSDDDVFLFVGCDMFLYSALQGAEIGTGNTISTPVFSDQLLHYYEKYPQRIPTVVFVDREYAADFSVVLLQEPFQSFMETYFDMDEPVTEGPVTVYFRK